MTFSDAIRGIAYSLAFLIAIMIAVRASANGRAIRNLLVSKATFAPEQMQLLLVTLLLAVWYFVRIMAAQGSGLPPLSGFCIWAFGISSVIYAIGHAVRTFRSLSHKGEEA
jgi:hypothetical protein